MKDGFVRVGCASFPIQLGQIKENAKNIIEYVKKANEVEPLEQVIDSLNSSLKNHHIERLQSGKCTIELGFILSDVMTDFERISDHCSNIAVCVSQIHSGSFDTHEYLHALKKEEEFESEYKELKKQYQLPTLKA